MEAFVPNPPEWTETATHVFTFCCPNCNASVMEAEKVWLNRYAPVISEDYRKKWQEFYQCKCGQVWWAWSTDRPQSNSDYEQDVDMYDNPF